MDETFHQKEADNRERSSADSSEYVVNHFHLIKGVGVGIQSLPDNGKKDPCRNMINEHGDTCDYL